MEQKVRREIIAWFWVGLVFLLINGAIGQARVIPSGSMENTLLIGDHLIMSRVGYDAGIPFTGWHVPLWRNPKRQQIIIFKPPFDTSQPDYVKRAIGLPGDVIDIHDGAVWINGQRLVEPYTLGKTERVDPGAYAGAFSGLPQVMPYKIPDNCYFAMGDGKTPSIRVSGAAYRATISSELRCSFTCPSTREPSPGSPARSAKGSWPT